MNYFYPILACPLIIRRHQTTFYLPCKEITVTIPAALSKKLVTLCDGTHNTTNLIEHLSLRWDHQTLEQLFEQLISTDVLLQSRNISPALWQFIRNPTAWKPELSQHELVRLMIDDHLQRLPTPADYQHKVVENDWTRFLGARQSCRNLEPHGLPEEALVRILWSSYGTILSRIVVGNQEINKRTVPSAGALYPITIHVYIIKQVGSIKPGIYRITMSEASLVRFHLVGQAGDITKCFVDPEVLSQAVGCILISASISRSSVKYGNRSILYCTLEAGHVAQNIHLAAQHENVGTIEIGGFFEKELSAAFKLPSEVEPLITILFGGISKNKTIKDKLPTLSESDIIRTVENITEPVQGYQLPFNMVFAESVTPSTGAIWWSCGKDIDPKQAFLKAEAEAIEWFVCGCVSRVQLTEGSFHELGPLAIDPQAMIRYLPSQFRYVPKMKPFDNTFTYQWLPVTSENDGTTALVLADFAFFPYTPKFGRRYAFANSSGTAAHATIESALEHAVLENIEREAFMVTWLNRIRRTPFRKESLPNSIQRRIHGLELLGFHVEIVDITYDLTPVVLIVLSYTKGSFFSCSTASGYNYECIIDRSLKEAEASAYCRLRDGSSRTILTKSEVISTMDHGGFYENARRRTHALFLFGDQNDRIPLREMEERVRIRSREMLYDRIASLGMNIYFADMTMQCRLENLSFKVVRAFIPGMVPMNFGHGIEPLGLDRVQALPVQAGILPKKVGAHRLNRWPHPFT